MLKPLKSAIKKMDRLELALLAAEARVKALNSEGGVRIAQMRSEIAALKLNSKSSRGNR